MQRVKPPIHDATCNMQLVACNRIASCVLEKWRVASGVKLLQVNRIVVYSLQHVVWSFKGFTGNAATEHLSIGVVICTCVAKQIIYSVRVQTC